MNRYFFFFEQKIKNTNKQTNKKTRPIKKILNLKQSVNIVIQIERRDKMELPGLLMRRHILYNEKI